MKANIKRPLLKIVFITVSLLLLFYFAQPRYEHSQPQNQIVDKASPGSPLRLTIPTIGVVADIQYVGVTPQGEMEVPKKTGDVGWFKIGPRPGENGSAVIAGHLNGKGGDIGVFANLDKLKKGDTLYVQDTNGRSIAFVVRESRIYDPGYAHEVFSQQGNARLNLITCDGVWDAAKKSYSKRLVVFTDIL